MLSGIRSFISRHRRKFFGVAVTGAIIWGGWNYFNWRMRRSEEDYVREVLNRAKRHMHHKSSAQAAERQAMALAPVATKATDNALDTNAIVYELRGGWTDRHAQKTKSTSLQQSKSDKGIPVSLTPEERIAKWDELKRVSIARAVAYAYVPSILIVFLRLQLGLLGGYVFRSCGGDNIAAFLNGDDERQSKEEKQDSMSVEIQEAYLSISQYFLEGKPYAIDQQQENPFKGSRENFMAITDSSWAEHKGNQNNIKGKSKLNLNLPSTDLNGAVGGHNSFSTLQQKHNGISTSMKCHVEVGKCGPKGDSSIRGNSGNIDVPLIHDAVCSSEVVVDVKELSIDSSSSNNEKDLGMGDGTFNLGSQENEQVKDQTESSTTCEKHETKKEEDAFSVPVESQIVCSKPKDDFLVNGMPGRCDSSDSGTQGCELAHFGVAAEEIDDQRDSISREIVEGDSGRSSGIDDASEEEIVEVKSRKSGIEMLCSLLESKVGRVVDGTSLKMPLSLADTETLFWGVLTSVRSNPAEDPAFNLPKYLLPPPNVLKGMAEDLESRLDQQAASLFLEMVSETADLLETKEVVELVQSCVSAGLGHIMDRLANYFPQDPLSFGGPMQSLTGATVRQQVQVKQSQQTMPMARLIPIISKVAFEEGTPWVKQLLEMSNLKDFGANVYEAFTH